MTTQAERSTFDERFEALAQKLAGVDGWLYDGEAWELAKLARDYPRSDEPLNVVEIGSWKGRSTICLAFGMQARPGVVCAIDPHLPASTGHTGEYGDVDTFAEFLENVRRAGFGDRVTAIREMSGLAALRLQGTPIHVLFVDGAHEYSYVIDDIRKYEPLLADYAFVAFNDPSRPGVFRALRETVLRDDSHFHCGRVIQNSIFFVYDRHAANDEADRRQKARFRRVLELRAFAARYRRFMPMPFVRLGHRLSAMLAGHEMERT